MNSSIKTAQLQNKTAQFHRLYGELVALLNEQLNCLKNSDSQKLEQLAEQSGRYIEQIGMLKILGKENFKTELEHLRSLYSQLCLSVSDQKEKVGKEISQVRRTNRTLKTYRKSI